MAKPPLTVIGHAGTGREPPIVLGERGRALWDSLRREFVIADAAGIELLRKPERRLTGPRRYAPPRSMSASRERTNAIAKSGPTTPASGGICNH